MKGRLYQMIVYSIHDTSVFNNSEVYAFSVKSVYLRDAKVCGQR